jgi:ADP-heptose:LPS heptosyltransferase
MREFSWLISKQIKNPDPAAHCIQRHLSVAKFLGCPEIFQYPIAVSDTDKDSAIQKLVAEGININKMLAIHAGGGWLSRRWLSQNFGLLCQKIKGEFDLDIVLIGGKEGGSGEKGLNEEILSYAGNVKIFDMSGKFSLKELCAFFSLCKVFVGNEAGPAHIANALNVQSVAILGPTDAARTGPYKGRVKVIQKSVPCQPCRNRNCPNPICMTQISVDEVFREVAKKIKAVL